MNVGFIRLKTQSRNSSSGYQSNDLPIRIWCCGKFEFKLGKKSIVRFASGHIYRMFRKDGK